MSTFPSNLIPDFPITESTVFNTLKTDIKYGPNARRRKWNSGIKRRVFDVKFNKVTASEMVLLSNFYNSMNGDLDSFTWVHPETSVSYTVKFSNDNLSFEEEAEGIFSCGVQFTEVLS